MGVWVQKPLRYYKTTMHYFNLHFGLLLNEQWGNTTLWSTNLTGIGETCGSGDRLSTTGSGVPRCRTEPPDLSLCDPTWLSQALRVMLAANDVLSIHDHASHERIPAALLLPNIVTLMTANINFCSSYYYAVCGEQFLIETR